MVKKLVKLPQFFALHPNQLSIVFLIGLEFSIFILLDAVVTIGGFFFSVFEIYRFYSKKNGKIAVFLIGLEFDIFILLDAVVTIGCYVFSLIKIYWLV